MPKRRWVRQAGDGLIWEGPCLIHSLILWPDSDGDYAYIYDGRDSISGELFCRLEAATSTTLSVDLGDGEGFDSGIYVDAKDSAVEVTVGFTPLSL